MLTILEMVSRHRADADRATQQERQEVEETLKWILEKVESGTIKIYGTGKNRKTLPFFDIPADWSNAAVGLLVLRICESGYECHYDTGDAGNCYLHVFPHT